MFENFPLESECSMFLDYIQNHKKQAASSGISFIVLLIFCITPVAHMLLLGVTTSYLNLDFHVPDDTGMSFVMLYSMSALTGFGISYTVRTLHLLRYLIKNV